MERRKGRLRPKLEPGCVLVDAYTLSNQALLPERSHTVAFR